MALFTRSPKQPGLVTPSASTARLVTAESVERQLRESPYSALKNVTWEFHEGVLTLRGRVPSYFLKQMAQAAVAKAIDVERIHNRIEVGAPGQRTGKSARDDKDRRARRRG